MKWLGLVFFLLIQCLYAREITTFKEIRTNSAVTDFVRYDDNIAIATTSGIVEIYDINSFKKRKEIKLPQIKDVIGDLYGAKIFSIDYTKDKLLMSSLSSTGFREIYIYENSTLTKVLDKSKKLFIQEVRFIDNNRILIATISNHVILYGLKEQKQIYNFQVEATRFFDFVLNEEKNQFYITDENKYIHKFDVNTGKELSVYKGNNTKHIFKLDFKNNKLLAGSKDGKVILFDTLKSYRTHKADFFVFSVALNDDATKAAYVKNEAGDIAIVSTKRFKELYLLKRGHRTVINKIDFVGPNEIISASDEASIKFWDLSN